MALRTHLLACVLLTALFTPPLASQDTGQINGRIVGAEGRPLSGASVAARSVADTTRAVGAISAANGTFRILVPAGDYRVRIVHLGYEGVTLEVSLAPGAMRVDLGDVLLTPSAIAIEGVTVEGERSPIVVEADRTIYRTSEMPAIQGGVATDALRSVPELDVDLEGRVTLRGASPRIHINGRPTPMTGEALQRFLQQLPSDRIDRVEIMPNPSARYDAEGAGGIVNIVLKRDAGLGLSGSVGLTGGTRGETGAFTNLAYQQGKLTLFGNGSVNLHRRDAIHYDLRQNLVVEPTTFLLQEGRSANRGRFNRFDLSAEYQVTPRSTLWSAASGGGYGSDAEGATAFTFMDAAQAPIDRQARTNSSTWNRFNAEASTGLKHVLEEGKHELALEARHTRHGGGNDGSFLTRLLDVDGNELSTPPQLLVNDTEEEERRTWLKVDYDRPVGDFRLQLGYQANLQTTTSDQLRESFVGDGGTPVSTVRNAFRYDETFHQMYVTGRRTIGKLALQAGVRVEQARTEFHLPTEDEPFDNEYTSIFPNFNANYEVAEGRRLGLNYSRRVQRPWLWYLNPIDGSIDPMTRRVGNPRLLPQYVHSFGGSFNWTGSRGNFRINPYFRSTENDFGQITSVDSAGVLTTTWENVASMRSYGTQIGAMMRSTGRLSGNVGLGLHREIRDASNLSEDFSGTSFRYNANGNLTVAIDRTLNLQGMLFYNSPHELPQGRRSAFVMSSIGLRKQIFENKGTLNLRVQDPFEMARFNFETRDRTHVQVARNDFSMRSASLSVSYNFGRRPRSVRRPGTDEGQQAPPDPMGVPQP